MHHNLAVTAAGPRQPHAVRTSSSAAAAVCGGWAGIAPLLGGSLCATHISGQREAGPLTMRSPPSLHVCGTAAPSLHCTALHDYLDVTGRPCADLARNRNRSATYLPRR